MLVSFYWTSSTFNSFGTYILSSGTRWTLWDIYFILDSLHEEFGTNYKYIDVLSVCRLYCMQDRCFCVKPVLLPKKLPELLELTQIVVNWPSCTFYWKGAPPPWTHHVNLEKFKIACSTFIQENKLETCKQWKSGNIIFSCF